MGRILPGTILGCVIAFLAIWAAQVLSGAIYPLPDGFDPYTIAYQGELARYHVPLGAQLLLLASWCVGTLLGGALAAYLSRRRIGAWIVAGLVVAGALSAARGIAHPAWMMAAGLLLPWLCALAVQGLATVRRARP